MENLRETSPTSISARTMCHADASHSDQLPSRLRPIGSVGASTSQAPWGSILLASMLSSIFFAAILSKPPKPTRVSAPAKPTQSVDKPAPYGVEAIPGFNPVRLPTGYPKDLQWPFHKNYRRDDQ